jgi:hypothetical protein
MSLYAAALSQPSSRSLPRGCITALCSSLHVQILFALHVLLYQYMDMHIYIMYYANLTTEHFRVCSALEKVTASSPRTVFAHRCSRSKTSLTFLLEGFSPVIIDSFSEEENLSCRNASLSLRFYGASLSAVSVHLFGTDPGFWQEHIYRNNFSNRQRYARKRRLDKERKIEVSLRSLLYSPASTCEIMPNTLSVGRSCLTFVLRKSTRNTLHPLKTPKCPLHTLSLILEINAKLLPFLPVMSVLYSSL